ncbi:hypothetical protein Tco_0878764 [Tanacetum coccineum]|uniref:Peptidase A2 domain-containing protein n=1 Tax=Tanacetum coccineum TaxID=301880 RepID=A0ABQ5C281_9ASTR
MEPNSRLGKFFFEDNVIEISSDKIEGSGDWNSLKYQDTTGSKGKKVMNALSFYRMETDEISERYIAPCFVNGLEAYDGEVNLEFDENLISNELAVKLCLDYEVKKGKKLVKKELIVALKGELYFVKFIINPEEDDFEPGVILERSFLRLAKGVVDFGRGIKRKEYPGAFIFSIRLEGKVNENALADTGSDINTMPYRIYEQLGREDMKKVGVTTLIAKFLILDIPIDRDSSIVVGRGFLHTIGGIVNVPERLFSTFDGFCHQTFRAARSDFMKNAGSDSDDEEDYQIKRNKFGAPIYGPKPAPYLNCNDLDERSLAIQTITNPFQKISVWKKAVSFLGLLPVPLKQVNWKPDYKGSYTKEEEATRQWRTEIRLTDPLQEHTIMRPNHQETNVLDNTKQWKKYCFHKFTTNICYGKDILNRMGCDGEIDDMLRIKLRKAESGEEIFTFVAWIRAFNIKEPIYAEFCHEFYSTYEFDEFDLVGVARRLGLYQAIELDEDGFNVYFEGGLRSDDHFNAQEYWLSISREENLNLSRSHASTIKYPILRVEHKMITYGLCQRTTGWMKRKGAGTQKESQICCRHFITKLARKTKVLTDDVIRSLSAPIYYRDLDTTTLRELIDYEGRLIPEDPQSGVPRVGIPRPPRASMQDLYDRMSHIEIRQEAIERMEYMQTYHWDRYQGVFEHIDRVYSVPLQGAYNPPVYT